MHIKIVIFHNVMLTYCFALKAENFPHITVVSGVPRNFVRGGVQQIQLRTEDRENGDLGAVAP